LATLRLRLALGLQRPVALGLLGPRPLRLQLDLAGTGRPALGIARLGLLARHLGHLGLLDQPGLEQLFLEGVDGLGHGGAPRVLKGGSGYPPRSRAAAGSKDQLSFKPYGARVCKRCFQWPSISITSAAGISGPTRCRIENSRSSLRQPRRSLLPPCPSFAFSCQRPRILSAP